METILITGGTGLIGTHLSKRLKEEGYQVTHLSRRANLNAEFPAYRWDITEGYIDPEALTKADHIIHLAGAGIVGKRWTDRQKQNIIDSRVKTIELLATHLQKLDKKPQSFISSSAVGYYGDTGEEIATEATPAGKAGFLAESCILWENAVKNITDLGIRTVRIRTGIVLSTLGGALPKVLMSFKVNTGTWFGDGQQYYPWIHIDDIAGIYLQALQKNTMNGAYNGTAPTPVTNKKFIQILAKALDKTALLVPTPAFVMRLAMGEMADTILHSSRVVPTRTLETGFEFQFTDLETAFQDVIQRKI